MVLQSPKRKRPESSSTSPLQTTDIVVRFPPLVELDPSDEINSPRSYVANKFQRLGLERQIPDLQLDQDGQSSKRLAFDDSGQERPVEIETSNSNMTDTIQPMNIKPPSTAFTFENSSFPSYPTEKRPHSPSLGGDIISDQYWHESEITGHDPDDPMDDGYGINGIGFKPTAAMAWARSQKRKQQLVEYRSREAREARERRSERRKTNPGDSNSGLSTVENSPKANKVRFENG